MRWLREAGIALALAVIVGFCSYESGLSIKGGNAVASIISGILVGLLMLGGFQRRRSRSVSG